MSAWGSWGGVTAATSPLLGVSRQDAIQGGGGNRAGHESRISTVLQRAWLPAWLHDAVAIGGLPFEKREMYIERSPLYQVDKLKTPMLVHVATNDTDVDFVEDQQIIDALRSRKPELAETKIYVDPTAGAGERWPHVQPAHEHEDAGTGRFARAARLLESHVGVFRVAPEAV